MSSDTSKMFLTVPIHIKVNWYEEKLDKFYETDKDNNGYIHGIYTELMSFKEYQTKYADYLQKRYVAEVADEH